MINTLDHIFLRHLLMARFLLSPKPTPFLLWVCNTKLICTIHFALIECQLWTNNLIWKIVGNYLGKWQLFLFWGCFNYRSSGVYWSKHVCVTEVNITEIPIFEFKIWQYCPTFTAFWQTIQWICECIHANNCSWSDKVSWLLLLAPTTQCHSRVFGNIFWISLNCTHTQGHRVGFTLVCIYFWLPVCSPHTSEPVNPKHSFIKCRTSCFRQYCLITASVAPKRW